MTKKLIYILILILIFYRFFEGPVFIIGGGVWITDIIVLLLFISFIFEFGVKINILKLFWGTAIKRSLFVILLISSIPIFIGILNGNIFSTILRDSRAVYFSILPFTFIYTFNSLSELHNFFRYFVAIIILNIIIFFVMLFGNLNFQPSLGIENEYVTEFGIIPRYGIMSALFFYPLAFFFLLNFIQSFKYKKIIILILFLILFIIFFNSIRSLTYGLVLGIMFSFFANPVLKRNTIPLLSIIIYCFFLLITFGEVQAILKNPSVHRNISLFILSNSNSVESINIKNREYAIKLAAGETDNLFFGNGYGDNSDLGSSFRDTYTNKYLNHSSIAFIIYKMGYLSLIIILVLFIYIVYRAYHLTRKNKIYYYNLFILTLISTLLLLLPAAFAANVFFRGDFYSISFAVVLGLLLNIERLYNNKIKILKFHYLNQY